MEFHEFRAMNTDILLGAEGEPDRVSAGFLQARAFVEASEARLTRFSNQSELTALNRASGDWFRASDALFEIVQEAVRLHTETEGLFDPSVLEALEHAGYDRSMDELRARGAARPRTGLGPHGGSHFDQVELVPSFRAIRLPLGMRIDLGGIAKGWIAERAARILEDHAQACVVDAGGDMFMLGMPSDAASWQVALEDPRDSSQAVALLNLGPGALATSSVVKRTWEQDGRQQHHLIDPRRDEPAETDWLSVTVVASHATTAEAYAKALLIAGSHEAGRIAARCPEIAYLAVDRDGDLWGSPKVRTYLNVAPEYA